MRQAGLFSAVTSAFIIEVNSKLEPDPSDETAALLRVLIHKIDNTTFGNDPPALPQWTGPPHTIVQVQAILFASLAVSLFSGFLAMLGKQWLNKYASIDMRGSAIERSQNRQRKLDGINTWYFDHVMEALPLMLQVALLLLGCALSWYFWKINTTVASVILAITSFGVLLYLLIIFVGAASQSCPYQTPGARILRGIPRLILDTPYRIDDLSRLAQDFFHRIYGIFHRISNAFHRVRGTFHALPHLSGILYSTFFILANESISCFVLASSWEVLVESDPLLPDKVTKVILLLIHIPVLSISLVADACRVIVRVLIFLVHVVQRGSEQQMGMLDQLCISWTLQTSLDGPVRLSTLNYLASTTLVDINPTLIVDCFDVLSDYIKKSSEGAAVITQGMEPLATVSALCCLHTLSHLTIIDPESRVLQNTRQRNFRFFELYVPLDNLPVPIALRLIHYIALYYSPDGGVFDNREQLQMVRWEDCKLSSNEHSIIACGLTVIARFNHRRRERVPRWLLRFALHSLSQSPPPSTSIVAGCLSIIAIDLGCDPSDTAILDERCVHIWWRATLLTKS